jgi:hypothetical protein
MVNDRFRGLHHREKIAQCRPETAFLAGSAAWNFRGNYLVSLIFSSWHGAC